MVIVIIGEIICVASFLAARKEAHLYVKNRDEKAKSRFEVFAMTFAIVLVYLIYFVLNRVL